MSEQGEVYHELLPLNIIKPASDRIDPQRLGVT
jgi:hypothetical protein